MVKLWQLNKTDCWRKSNNFWNPDFESDIDSYYLFAALRIQGKNEIAVVPVAPRHLKVWNISLYIKEERLPFSTMSSRDLSVMQSYWDYLLHRQNFDCWSHIQISFLYKAIRYKFESVSSHRLDYFYIWWSWSGCVAYCVRDQPMKLERLFHERVKGKFHTTINSYLGFKPNIWIACRIFYPKRVALQIQLC